MAVTHRYFRDEALSPPSALKYIGQERKLPRVSSETNSQYRERLLDAWRAWTFAGTPAAITGQLALLGYGSYIKENGGPGKTGDRYWDWDGNDAAWARFWVVIDDHPWSHDAGIDYDDGSNYDDGHLWDGLGATAGEIDDIRQIIQQWKPGNCFCAGIVVVTDPVTFAAEQPDGTWGDYSNRSTAAVYWMFS